MHQQEDAAEQFLVLDGACAVSVGHDIVDVLDEYHRSVDVVEVLYQGTVAAGTEHKASGVVAEEFVVGCHGDGVGRRFLLGHGHFILHSELLLHLRQRFGELGFENLAVVGRNGEVQTHLAALRRGRHGAFGELFLHGRAHRAVGVAVECQQRLGQLSVVETLALDDGSHQVFVAACLDKTFGGRTLAVSLGHGFLKLVIESEVPDALHQLSHGAACRRHILLAVDKSEESLEHARSRARCRDELQNIAAILEKTFPAGLGGFAELVVHCQHSLAGSRRHGYAEIRKTCTEALELCLHSLDADAFFLELLKVGGCKCVHLYMVLVNFQT